MDDLLQSQIRESCKLALPLGLQELMSDISREVLKIYMDDVTHITPADLFSYLHLDVEFIVEYVDESAVLRAQPENLYQFIASYLEALLNARETLSIACRLCGQLSNCSCEPQLDDELHRIGLRDEDVVAAKDIILDYFDKGQVKETSLLMKLTTKINVDEIQLENLQKAIHKAFQRHFSKHKDLQVSFAVVPDSSLEPSVKSTVSEMSTPSNASDFYKPSYSLDVTTTQDTQATYPTSKEFDSPTYYPPLNPTVSATTLAGSYVDLPHTIPYSVHTAESEKIIVQADDVVVQPDNVAVQPDNIVNKPGKIVDRPGKIVDRPDKIVDRPGKIVNRPDKIIDQPDNSVYQSEKSVLNLLKSFLFADDWKKYKPEKDSEYASVDYDNYRTDNEQIDNTIKSVFSQTVHDVKLRMGRDDTEGHREFQAIPEDLQESSSGDY